MTDLKFEVGKFYKTRDGKKIKCLSDYYPKAQDTLYPHRFERDESSRILSYTAQGSFMAPPCLPHPYDIIGPWDEMPKFEAGKCYRTRGGGKVLFIKYHDRNVGYADFPLLFYDFSSSALWSVTFSGKYPDNTKYDIVGPWKEPLTFEVGKYYKTFIGDKLKCVFMFNEKGCSPDYPFIFYEDACGQLLSYTIDGRFVKNENKPCRDDIVGLWDDDDNE